MELFILDEKDNFIINIPLDAAYPSQEKIQENLFYEDMPYKFKLILEESFEEVKELLLFIDEKPISIYYSKKDRCFKSELTNHFRNQYDLTLISVKIDESYYYSPYYQIATKKQLSRNIEKMIEEIENMQSSLLEICFTHYSKSRRESGIGKGENNRNISALIEIHRDVISKLNFEYPYFRNNPKSVVRQNREMIDIHKVRQFGSEEMLWILKHPEMLKEKEYKTTININGHSYLPEKISAGTYQNSCDIYENQLILAFIEELINNTVSINRYIQNNLVNKLKESLVNTRNLMKGYEIPSNFRVKFLIGKYEKIMNEINSITSNYHRIYKQYKSIFKEAKRVKFTPPKFTPTFRSIHHYRVIFETMNIWWKNYRTFNASGENYMMRLKKLSKIYEYYCLLKMILSLQSLGYETKESYCTEKSSDSISGDEPIELNLVYHFTNENPDIKLTLYYEPNISGDIRNNKGYDDLYTLRSRKSHLTPDYMIKFQYKNDVRYGIFDAKHTYEKNVHKKYLPETVLKYLHGIASINNEIGILFMWLLYPDLNGYNQINIQNSMPEHYIYPSIGVFSISPDVKTQDINRFLYKMLQNLQRKLLS